MPEHYDTARTADWLDGYRFALTNLHQPGVLADAHRYVDEDTAPPRATQPGDRVRVTFHPIRGQETPDPVESTVTGLGDYVGRLAVTRGSATVEVIEPAPAREALASPGEPAGRATVRDELEVKREAVREARRVISQYLVTAEQWRYDRVMWAFAIMLGEIPEDTPCPLSPADVEELRRRVIEPAPATEKPSEWRPAPGDRVTGQLPDGTPLTGVLTDDGYFAGFPGSSCHLDMGGGNYAWVLTSTLRPADTTQEAR